jgi:hypothetical protein
MHEEDINANFSDDSCEKEDNKTNANAISRTYGFIITRHVNSEKTNRYWNRCVKLIRTLYPYRLIAIIDDNSNPNFLKADHEYKNVFVVKSEYPGRGELLPYIYYARNKWFDRAVIIHDSVFFHKRVAFESMDSPVLHLWHFGKEFNKLHLHNSLRIAASLSNSGVVQNYLVGNRVWRGCFGVQTFINHSFLLHIMSKYSINNLLNVVTCREDRCSLERIFAVIFYLELRNANASILGNITRSGRFGFTYDEYINDLKTKKSVHSQVVKVFTGR